MPKWVPLPSLPLHCPMMSVEAMGFLSHQIPSRFYESGLWWSAASQMLQVCKVHTSVQKRGLARTVMTGLGPQSSDFTGRWSTTCILSCLCLHPLDLVRGKLVMSSVCTMHLRETKSHLEVGTKGGLT